MRIIYGFSNCTDKTYNRMMSEKNASAMQPDQKYHGLMIKGLAENGAELVCFSGLPVNRSVTSRKLVREKDEREGNALYHYITTVNFPVIRQLYYEAVRRLRFPPRIYELGSEAQKALYRNGGPRRRERAAAR